MEGEVQTIRVARRVFVGNLAWQTSWQARRRCLPACLAVHARNSRTQCERGVLL